MCYTQARLMIARNRKEKKRKRRRRRVQRKSPLPKAYSQVPNSTKTL